MQTQSSAVKKGKGVPGDGPNTVKHTINEIKEELGRARTWGEYFSSKVGQKFKNSFRSLQKQNPKDHAPLYEFIDKKNETEMFKVGRVFAPDRGHNRGDRNLGGEHFEVWDRNGNWLGVANLDGSKNIAKTNIVKNPIERYIGDIL